MSSPSAACFSRPYLPFRGASYHPLPPTAAPRTAVREPAPRGSSFHTNLTQVNSWIDLLLKDYRREPDAAFSETLTVIRTMLKLDPDSRPHAPKVAEVMHSTITTPAVHPMKPPCGLDTPMYGWPGSPLEPQTSHTSSGGGWVKSRSSTSLGSSTRWMAI